MKQQLIDHIIKKASSAIEAQLKTDIPKYLEESLNYFLQDGDVEKLINIPDYNITCDQCSLKENSDGSITINIRPLYFTLMPSTQIENENAD